MRINETISHQTSTPVVEPLPPSCIDSPTASPMEQVSVTDNGTRPPQQRSRRAETPPATATAYLRTHITPTKKADVGMLRAHEKRLALLPSAQPQPLPPHASPEPSQQGKVEPSIGSRHSSGKPEGIPPIPLIIPPTPLQHRIGQSHIYPSCTDHHGGHYQSPPYSHQGSAQSEGMSPMVAQMMMPPRQDRGDDYADTGPYINRTDSRDDYRCSPAELREGSMQHGGMPPYHPGVYPDHYGPSHRHLSPRPSRSGLPPARLSPHQLNTYAHHIPTQPSERSSTSTFGTRPSRSPPAVHADVPKPVSAPLVIATSAFGNRPSPLPPAVHADVLKPVSAPLATSTNTVPTAPPPPASPPPGNIDNAESLSPASCFTSDTTHRIHCSSTSHSRTCWRYGDIESTF